MKKILITSGGTKEFIDDVRVLTNISSGKLGALIADVFQEYIDFQWEKNYEIHYVYAKGSELPNTINQICFSSSNNIKLHEISTVDNLKEIMEKLVPEMDVVIHAMAVSDFGFEPAHTKLKSSDPMAFIDSLRSRIKINPKILPLIKIWNPNCKLISFKFEVDLEHDELVHIAKNSMINANGDLVIANDNSEMVREKSHIAYALTNDTETKLYDKLDIANFILNYVTK